MSNTVTQRLANNRSNGVKYVTFEVKCNSQSGAQVAVLSAMAEREGWRTHSVWYDGAGKLNVLVRDTQ